MLHRNHHHHNWQKDIVRYARHKFAVPAVDLTKPDPVAIRTAESYATRPVDCLAARKERQVRHRINLSRGHFSDQQGPYLNIGDVCLDSHALFCQTLGLELPPKENNHMVTNDVPLHAEKQKKDGTSSNDGKQKCRTGQKTVEAEISTLAKEFKERSGLAAIRDYLQETTDRRAAVHAGQYYLDHLADCKKHAEELAAPPESREMVIQKLSSHLLMANKQRKYTVAFCPETLTMQIKKKSDVHNARVVRKEKQLEERLDAIFMFLTSINNLKSKHLRQRTPLTKEAMMGLRKSHHSSEHTQNSRIGSGRYNFQDSNRSISHRSNTSKPDEVICFRPGRRQRGIKKEELGGPVTWEDFDPEAKAKAQKRRPWYNFATDRSQSIMRQTLLVHRIGITEQRYSGAACVVQNAKNDFTNARNTAVKTTLDKVNKHIRDRDAIYDLKARALSDLHPLWEVKGREVAKIAIKQLSKDGTIHADIQETSEWFQQLDKEVSEFVDPPPEIQVKLDQLRRFAYDSFPFTSVKEKLSLLTISLPVEEIFKPVIKNALIFVLVDVFKLSRDLLRQWLAYRNIIEPAE